MFQFRRFPSYTYLIQYRIPYGGFPHSEISGSMLICSSPKLIAAYHVLHRLLMPRHSPCALISLTIESFDSQSTITLEKSLSVLYYSWIMQAHIDWSLFRQNCILPNFLNNKFPFMLPSHNCIIITMFSFQGASLNLFKRLNEASTFVGVSVNLFLVESTGIEPVTSCLQGRRSPSWANPP